MDYWRTDAEPQPWAVCVRGLRDPARRARRRRWRGGAGHAVGNNHDGVRRVGPHRRPREDRRHGTVHVAIGASGVAVVNQRRDRVRDGSDLDLQQHVWRGDAGVSANDPELVSRLGGGDPLAIALSINVGSSLVDVSPLSTIGALAVAAVSDQQQSRELFRQLVTWGLSMTIIGAALCQLFAGALARA